MGPASKITACFVLALFALAALVLSIIAWWQDASGWLMLVRITDILFALTVAWFAFCWAADVLFRKQLR